MRTGRVAFLACVAMGVAALATAVRAGVGAFDPALVIHATERTLAGGPPDEAAPISTARYGDEVAGGETAPPARPYSPAPIELAGGPSPVSLGPVSLAQVEPRPREHLQVTVSSEPDWSDERRALGFVPNRAMPPERQKLIDGRALLVSIGPSETDAKRGRWFIFAAGSGKAFGLNMVRDPLKGWRQAGWSMEKLAEFGKSQLGLGWRKGSTQVSLAASRREIGGYGLSRKDTVVGISVSVKPGK